ncbi:MAG: hypothetical protein ACRC1T_06365 [Clostridium chrysemydis]|uniref:hypothetical protein n=1 Tax=Clostridium chrysemydis TaxID=2665504 RepID=UPI003F2D33AB
MNRVNWKAILYIIIGVVIIGAVISLFISLLPFILIGMLVLWGYFKLKGKKVEKEFKKNENVYEERETYYSNEKMSDSEDDDFDTSKAIDVDYENIDDK